MAKPTDLPAPQEPVIDETDSAEASPPAARRGRAAVLSDARLAWAVALLAVIAAVLLGLDASSLRAREAARQAAQDAAEVVAAQITTFDGTAMDEWVRDVQSLSTEDFAEEVTGLFDQDFRDALADNEVSSVGEIQSSFVQELEGDEATVFVLARQTSTNTARAEPVVDELRMEIVLERVDGRWLADEVAVLGPAGLTGSASGEQ